MNPSSKKRINTKFVPALQAKYSSRYRYSRWARPHLVRFDRPLPKSAVSKSMRVFTVSTQPFSPGEALKTEGARSFTQSTDIGHSNFCKTRFATISLHSYIHTTYCARSIPLYANVVESVVPLGRKTTRLFCSKPIFS